MQKCFFVNADNECFTASNYIQYIKGCFLTLSPTRKWKYFLIEYEHVKWYNNYYKYNSYF